MFSNGLSRLGGRCGVRRLLQPSGSHAGLRKVKANSGRRGDRILRGALYNPGLRFYLLARSNERRQDRLRLLESDLGRSFRGSCATGGSTSASGSSALGCNARNDNERFANIRDAHATNSDRAGGAAGAWCGFPTATSTGSAHSGSSGIGCPGAGTRARPAHRSPGGSCNFRIADPARIECPGSDCCPAESGYR